MELGIYQDVLIESIFLDWQNIVGEFLASHLKPTSVNNKILYLQIDDWNLEKEIKALETKIIDKINNTYGCKLVEGFLIIYRKDCTKL